MTKILRNSLGWVGPMLINCLYSGWVRKIQKSAYVTREWSPMISYHVCMILSYHYRNHFTEIKIPNNRNRQAPQTMCLNLAHLVEFRVS